MIKKVCLLFLMALTIGGVSAQDLIVLANGNVIKAKVTKIDGDKINYKNYDNQDGPELTIFTRDVLSINYENGTVQSFSVDMSQTPQQTQQTSQPVYTVSSSSNNDSWKQMERQRLLSASKTWETVGDVLYWLNCLGGIGAGLYLTISYGMYTYGGICLGAGLASGFFWLILCGVVSSSLERQANDLAYIPLLHYDFQFENSIISTSVGAMSFNNADQSSNGLALSTPAIGGSVSLRF